MSYSVGGGTSPSWPTSLTGVGHASGLVVITLAGGRVSAITRFESAVLSRFGLPRTLPVVP